MSSTITFYYNPMSRARIIQWMLEETGQDYEIKLVDWRKNEQKSPEFLKINPMGKIPTLVHRGVVVTETAAICAYLADAFPNSRLAPPVDSPLRGSYYRWLFFAAGCVEPALADKTNPRSGEVRASMLGYGTYDDTVNTLEKAVSNTHYLTGSEFSAADVYVGSQIGWGIQFKTLPDRPAFRKYVSHLQERPAYQRAEVKAKQFMIELEKIL